MPSNFGRVYIRILKSSGSLEFKIDGYADQANQITINDITAVNFALATPQPFQTGLTYGLAQIANFFLNESAFDSGTVSFGNADPVALSTFLGAPSMTVSGNGVVIADGDASPSTSDHTDFGTVAASSGTIVRTFTVANIGAATLRLSGSPLVVVGGANAADFTVVNHPQAVLSPGKTCTFQVSFDPSATGSRAATLSIANSDSAVNPYNFSISGTGS